MKKYTRIEKELLQAKTEISNLKQLLFNLRTYTIEPAAVVDGISAHRLIIQATDFDYTTIPVYNYQHQPRKKAIKGCQCYKCNNLPK